MAYTTIDDPTIYFNTKLYTGDGATGHAITGVGFQPDFTWIRNRNSTDWHWLQDAVRGATKVIFSNTTNAESTQAQGLTSFNSDGFTVGTDTGNNGSGNNIVSWNWKAGTAFTNDASATGIGSIDSSGSVNTDAGFSIVSFTATGSAGTIKHGLSTAPKMIIVKCRGASSTWSVYHASLGATKFLRLEDTSAVGTETGWWNDTAPTSSVFTIGGNHSANTQIAYCFADVKGYSKVGGSYTGNGNADGPMIWTGFKPAWVMIKRTNSSGEGWSTFDNKRSPHNVMSNELRLDVNSAEATSNHQIDFLSNGFKPRGSTVTGVNGSGDTYIYMCFAENPFTTSSGVPATAR